MIQLVDTHCHLAHGRLRQDVQGALGRASQADVVAVVCAAGDLAETSAAATLAGQYPQVWFTAGVHPHEAKDAAEGYLQAVEQAAEHPRCVAIGEIGLDYHYDFSPRDVQRRVLGEQLALARRLGRVAVIHTREAFDDTMAILRDSGLDGSHIVLHSFTGGPSAAQAALDLGATLSFSGIVTFRNADELRASAAMAPADRILVETDAPFLSPEPVRKTKTNEPANVRHVAARLAEIRGVPLEELAEQTTANARRVFPTLTLPAS